MKNIRISSFLDTLMNKDLLIKKMSLVKPNKTKGK